jgi:putative drug exporter of the RND superfamily
MLAEGFGPGFNGPFLLVAEIDGPADIGRLGGLTGELNRLDGVEAVSPIVTNEDGTAALISVVPSTAPQDLETDQLVKRIRDEVVPATAGAEGLEVHVGGLTAVFSDFADQVSDRLPILVGAVISLSFLLLLVVFRSILVPLKAAIMNLLSVGAAYGVIVAIFQWGWGADIFGIGRPGPIEAWVPIMMFAILFGLSMDYEVFLLSRVREEYVEHGDNALAVANGLARTARVISAAAAIMIMVFLAFFFAMDLRAIRLFAFGLTVAVLVDVTVVRMALVPSTMELLGDANWWLPKWLDRVIPHFSIESGEDELARTSDDEPDAEPEPVGVS